MGDEDNAYGTRPESITVHLFAGGTEVDSAELNAENGWLYIFRDLPEFNMYEEKIVYNITEDPVERYTTKIDGFRIVNTYQPKVVSVWVKKVWDDNDNAYGLRPTSIMMRLSNGMRVVLSERNNWSAMITGLPMTIDGKPVKYSWTEEKVTGYTLTGVTTDGNVTVFTNTLHEKPPMGGAELINHVGDCFD